MVYALVSRSRAALSIVQKCLVFIVYMKLSSPPRYLLNYWTRFSVKFPMCWPISPPPQFLSFVCTSFVKAWLAGPWLIPARQREAEDPWEPSCLSSLLPDVLQFLGSRMSLTLAHVLNKQTISWELVGVWEQSFIGPRPTSACDFEDMT